MDKHEVDKQARNDAEVIVELIKNFPAEEKKMVVGFAMGVEANMQISAGKQAV